MQIHQNIYNHGAGQQDNVWLFYGKYYKVYELSWSHIA